MTGMQSSPTAPADSDDWVALTGADLPVTAASTFVARPDCGAVVTFAGLARDHAPGRPNVDQLEYEAYEGPALERLRAVATETRRRWPAIRRIALLHRTGVLGVGDTAVVVAVSSPHRPDAFAGAAFAIDELKRTVPIWKRERWEGGEDWGLACEHLIEVGRGGVS